MPQVVFLLALLSPPKLGAYCHTNVSDSAWTRLRARLFVLYGLRFPFQSPFCTICFLPPPFILGVDF